MALPKILAALFLILALYCGIDPFNHCPMSDFKDIKVLKVDLPLWSSLPKHRDTLNLLQKSQIKFLNQIQGPESIAFDPQGRGPYTGVADGRVLFWNGESLIDFAYTSPNRSEICDPKPLPLSYLKNEHICGRPLGLRFDKKTGDLYIADAYFGLMKVGPEGGLATSLTREAEGIPLTFTNDLDIDEQGNVIFTDSSTIFQRRNFLQLAFTAENSGRILKYSPSTGETTVLVRNLQFPNGVSLSKDGSFFAFTECSTGRLWKYWLKGEKEGKWEMMAILPGFPDNVRTNEKGEFWVAMHSRLNMYAYITGLYPNLRRFLLKLPVPAKIHYLLHIGGRIHGLVAKYSPEGEIVQILEDSEGKVVKAVSEVEENEGKLWMGSVMMPFVAVYDLQQQDH
ncbi:protein STRICTOSIDINE SYNTHASE-LIKE 3-like [Impatiens glandulifera]|uniref:protein STRICTOSIDINE SYNTHASE-LIKE 3-like n=1 Tax=Impatiens glandulifera TaxID=253017 RepID=UPI001FB11243|nr:protein STRICTOSIDINE SYNTHASE-LIKE 3-like [Impatiens glandulifera]